MKEKEHCDERIDFRLKQNEKLNIVEGKTIKRKRDADKANQQQTSYTKTI